MKLSGTSKAILAASSAIVAPAFLQAAPPNVVIILADDMGYGDVSAFNPQSKIKTTAIDGLCSGGVVFTDAHSCSGVSTPSRYGLLTGRYPFRTVLKDGITDGFSKPMITPDRSTIASVLSGAGYSTACVGKWHLGWEWAYSGKEVDYSKPITEGPTTRGFDYFFGIPASLDMVPYVYIENDRITAAPDRIAPGLKGLHLMRSGPQAPNFEPTECLQRLTGSALDYIDAQDGSQPFFLYFPLTAPHTPIFPSEEFLGKSGLSLYGDFVLMVDDVVRQMVDKLKERGLYDNTIIVFTSDNGCAPYAGMADMESKGHYSSYIYRGAKADLYDGGNRIPLVVSWGGRQGGVVYAGIASLADLYATFAEMAGHKLSPGEGEDSYSLWSVINGKGRSSRKAVVSQSIDGSFTLRQGRWKMLFAGGSGGWSFPALPGDKDYIATQPPVQLYDMKKDIGEKNNVVESNPRVAEKMTSLMRSYVINGRSTPGPAQENQTKGEWRQTKVFIPEK